MKKIRIFLITLFIVAPAFAQERPTGGGNVSPATQTQANKGSDAADFMTPSSQANKDNMVNVLGFGAAGDGVTDDSTAFQTAINTGKKVYVPYSSNGYVIGNLVLTNGGGLIGDGARLIPKTGTTGFLILYGHPSTNYDGFNFVTNVIPQNITVSGLEIAGPGTNYISPNTNVYQDSATNINGIWFDPFGTNCLLEHVFVHGLSGIGILSQSYTPSTGTGWPNDQRQQDQPLSHIEHVTANGCGAGIWLSSGIIKGGFTNDAGNAHFSGEYQTLADCHASYNSYGLILDAGNCNISACDFSHNNVEILMGETGNSGHGSIVGTSINHSGPTGGGGGSTRGIIITNLVRGFVFSGDNIWFSSTAITNSCGITFQGCEFESSAIYAVGSTNIIKKNNFDEDGVGGLYASGGSINCEAYNNIALAGSIGNAQQGMSDSDKPVVITPIPPFLNTTINSTWPPTYASLGACGTNSCWMFPSNATSGHISAMWFGTFDASSNTVFLGHIP